MCAGGYDLPGTQKNTPGAFICCWGVFDNGNLLFQRSTDFCIICGVIEGYAAVLGGKPAG